MIQNSPITRALGQRKAITKQSFIYKSLTHERSINANKYVSFHYHLHRQQFNG